MADYRIAELAEAAGVSVRNIRVYQDRGLLPPPRLKGRVGLYDDDHLTRLVVISRMLERGYTFATISELLLAAKHDMTVTAVLGAPAPQRRGLAIRSRLRGLKNLTKVTRAELKTIFGDESTDVTIALSERLGLLVGEGAHYVVREPDLLEVAELLVSAGVPLVQVLTAWEQVQNDVHDIAERFVTIVTDRYMSPEGEFHPSAEEVSQAAELITQLRPLAPTLVANILARELDAEISRALGRAAERLGLGDEPEAEA